MDSFPPVSFMDNITFASEISRKLGNDYAAMEGILNQETVNQKTVEQYIYEDNWLIFINKIADELEKLRLNNHHYLFIGGIDTRPSDIPYEEYKKCIYPLVRAGYDLNCDLLSRIKDRNKGRLQIILLTRLDIFLNAELSNAGSKISDNSAFLNWSFISEKDYAKTDLFSLVNNMLNSTSSGDMEQTVWDHYFGFDISRGQQTFDSFVYFLRLTTSKPRDFVKLLKIVKEQCQSNSLMNPNSEIIESDLFQRAYSTYFAKNDLTPNRKFIFHWATEKVFGLYLR